MAAMSNMSPQALAAWEQLNATWGKPLTVNSAYRDPAQNAAAGGAKRSQHMHGNAFDVSTAGLSPADRAALVQAANSAGFTGYGGYNNALHLDVGPRRTWGADYTGATTPDWLTSALGGNAPAMQGRVSTQGSQPMTPTQQAPQGILEMMGIQKRDPSAQDQTALPFYQRDQFKNTMGNIAMAANTLRQRPDDNITAQVQSNRQQRADSQSRNRTIEYLRANGREDLAGMVEAGQISGKDVMSALATKTIGGTGADGVQSSTALPDQSGVVMTMRDGSIVVKTIGGETLTGQAALDFARTANENYAGYQSDVYAARVEGTNLAETETGGAAAAAGAAGTALVTRGFEAFDQAEKASSSLIAIDNAIAAIDNNAEAGLIWKFIPDVTQASASLNNAMNKMGLDVINSVTFGALSAPEMKLAMETAVPRDLAPPELRAWLVEKRDAQAKARDALMRAANYFTVPGNTLQGWQEKQAEAASTTPPTTGGQRLRYNPTTGKFE